MLQPLNQERKKLLIDYGLHLITYRYPSMSKCAELSNGKFNNENVVQTLKDLKFCEKDFKALRLELFKSLDKRLPIYLAGDDVLVEKIGEQIEYTQKLFDHTKKEFVNGMLVVDVAIKYNGVILGAIYELKVPALNVDKYKGNKVSIHELIQFQRTTVVKKLIEKITLELKTAGFSKNRIWALFDRWYPSKGLISFLRSLQVKFVIATKKSTSILLPDKQKYLRSFEHRRGRKPKNFTKTVILDHFFSKYRTSHSMTIEGESDQIEYKEVQCNLTIASQVKVVAFRPATQIYWRYFITNALSSSAHYIYFQYSQRWSIEHIHEDSKQVFGMSKGQMRKEEHIKGYMTFVYFLVNIFLEFRFLLFKCSSVLISAKDLYQHVCSLIPSINDPLESLTCSK